VDVRKSLVELTRLQGLRELCGGHQSRVFEATQGADGQRVIVKVLDASLHDYAVVSARVAVIAELAALDGRVCRPLPLDGQLVTNVSFTSDDGGSVVCYEPAGGEPVTHASESDATLMGRTLAELHDSMRSVPNSLPLVTPLDSVQVDIDAPLQLVHGDFNDANLRPRWLGASDPRPRRLRVRPVIVRRGEQPLHGSVRRDDIGAL
jgi:Ser/Thr protein kinase RdoA (MazF antagonist)